MAVYKLTDIVHGHQMEVAKQSYSDVLIMVRSTSLLPMSSIWCTPNSSWYVDIQKVSE
jgi:hypothetical protein